MPAESRGLWNGHGVPSEWFCGQWVGLITDVSHVPGKGPVTVVVQVPIAHASPRTGPGVGAPEGQPPVTLAWPGLGGVIFNCLVAGCHLPDSVGWLLAGVMMR